MANSHQTLTAPINLETSDILPTVKQQRRSSALSHARKRLFVILLLSALPTLCAQASTAQAPHPVSNTEVSGVADKSVRELLLAMKGDHQSTDQLAILFKVGDEKIAELIRALGDSNEDVKLSAQLIIRYLGNEEGMEAWVRDYESKKTGSVIAPIPTPLRDWDYEFIRSLYLRDKMMTEVLR